MVLKGRRKLKEERLASRGDPSAGSAADQGRLSSMQSIVDKQKSDIAKLKQRLTASANGDPKGKGRNAGGGKEGE